MNLNMNLSINNTIICQDLRELNFKQIKKGQQILVINPHTYDYDEEQINYSDFTVYFSKGSQINNVYSFDRLATNIEVDDCFYSECLEMDANPDIDSCYYLRIKNDLLELDYIDSVCDIDELDDYDFKYFKELYEKAVAQGLEDGKYARIINKSVSFEQDIQDGTKYKCCLYDYFLIYLEGSLMGIRIKRSITPSIYRWNVSVEYYLFDEEFKHYTTLCFNKKQEQQIIDIIDKNYWNFYSESCVKNLKVYHAMLKQIRTDSHYKQMLIDILNNHFVYHISLEEVLETFLRPIYRDGELDIDIYLKDCNFIFNPSIDVDYIASDNPTIKQRQRLVLRKGETLLSFLTRYDCPIDIYTGEIIDKTYRKQYEDYEYILLDNDRAYNKIYQRIDDELFIELQDIVEKERAIKIIEERNNICNTLTE